MLYKKQKIMSKKSKPKKNQFLKNKKTKLKLARNYMIQSRENLFFVHFLMPISGLQIKVGDI